MNLPNPLRALLFDLDGTVADTHGLILRCYDHSVRKHLGREGKREIWEPRVGLPLDEILKATFTHYGEPEPSEELLETIKQSYRSHMRESDSQIQAFPGIPETLAACKERGLLLAIVTTKHQGMALRHLEITGLSSYFDAVICGDMCERCKPDPEPFQKALEALQIAPSEAIAIGDSRHDIIGAKAAGVFAVAACWGTDNRRALIESAPNSIAETPAALFALI